MIQIEVACYVISCDVLKCDRQIEVYFSNRMKLLVVRNRKDKITTSEF